MIFNGEGIHLTLPDRVALEYGGEPSFSWGQFRRLHCIVTEMFGAEFNCEFDYFDRTRREGKSFQLAFTSECLQEFTTHRLGQMAVSLDSIAGVQ